MIDALNVILGVTIVVRCVVIENRMRLMTRDGIRFAYVMIATGALGFVLVPFFEVPCSVAGLVLLGGVTALVFAEKRAGSAQDRT